MAKASLENIKKLRKRTGVDLHVAKAALDEVENDLEKAFELLRSKNFDSPIKSPNFWS